MQAREALSSRAAQFRVEGLPQHCHTLALKGICCFAPRTVASRTGSPMPLAALCPWQHLLSGIWWALPMHSQSSLPDGCSSS